MSCGMRSISGYTLGVIYIILCSLIWAGASVLIQFIYSTLDCNSPFLLTYLATGLLFFHLPGYLLREKIQRRRQKLTEQQLEIDNRRDYASIPENTRYTQLHHSIHDSESSIHSSLPSEESYSPLVRVALGRTKSMEEESLGSISTNSVLSDAVVISRWEWLDSIPGFRSLPFTHQRAIIAAVVVCPIWFGANLFYNYSLLMTSVSSSTIISNLSGSFTLAFSRLLGLEMITIAKVLGVLICFTGAALVTLDDTESSADDDGDVIQPSMSGDILAGLGAIGYGLYTVSLRKLVPDEEAIPIQLVLGYVGVTTLLVVTPIFIPFMVMGIAGLDKATFTVFGFMVLTGFADAVVADYLWARAVMLTSPTIATIGMSVTIPLALLSDWILNGVIPTVIAVFGAITVIIGFIFVNLDDQHFRMAYDWLRSLL